MPHDQIWVQGKPIFFVFGSTGVGIHQDLLAVSPIAMPCQQNLGNMVSLLVTAVSFGYLQPTYVYTFIHMHMDVHINRIFTQ